MKPLTIKYPTREWLGKYESWLVVMKGGAIMRKYDRVLERFFATFPKKTNLEDITSIDAADYRVILEKKGRSPKSIKDTLSIIRMFWDWLIEDKELPLFNPVKLALERPEYRFPKGTFVKRHSVSLVEVNHILEHCTSLKAKRIVLKVLCGEPGWNYSRSNAGREIKEAAFRAKVYGFKFPHLKVGGNRLAREIIQAYCEQVEKTFSMEAKPEGDSLGDIEGTSLNIGTPICHEDEGLMAVGRVN
jgi:hypothetical protein